MNFFSFPRADSSGFTLLELLIGMAMTLFITASLSQLLLFQHHRYHLQADRAEMWQTLLTGLDFMEREVRLAGYGLPPGAVSLTTWEDQVLELRLDLDDDGTGNVLSYRFSASRNQLQRRVDNGPWSPLVEQVTQLSFSYRDGAGQIVAHLSEVQQVGIDLTVQGGWRDPARQENNGYRILSINRTIPLRNVILSLNSP